MSLFKKMFIKQEDKLLVLNQPANVEFDKGFGYDGKEKKGEIYDAVILFAENSKVLKNVLPKALKGLSEKGKLWIAYPKKSSKIKTDISRDQGWEVIVEQGWEGVSLVAIDNDWSAMRFKKIEVKSNVPSSKKQKFTATLIKDDSTTATAIEIPFNVYEIYETKAQLRVKGTINNKPFKGSLAPYGGKHYLGIKKELRDEIGIKAGDIVNVILEPDLEERIVEVPLDFQKAMKDVSNAYEVFTNYAYTHRKEYVNWIESAKKEETRKARIEKAIDMLLNNKKIS